MSKKVLIAGFMHETNTFSCQETDLEAYRARTLVLGDKIPKAVNGTRTEIAGFLAAGAKYGWTMCHPVMANATPSGPVTKETFDFIAGEILDALDNQGPFDAVMLNLHGAMVCEHVDDGEGELLSQVRAKTGPDIPIGITLDLHANVTDAMTEFADIVVAYRTYPHVDMFEVAEQVSELVHRTLEGEIDPCSVVVRGDMLHGVDGGRTFGAGPMNEILATADGFLGFPGIHATSMCAGFPWADVLEAGPSAVIVGEKAKRDLSTEMAEKLIAEAWQKRARSSVEVLGLDEAIIRTKQVAPRLGDAGGPVVLADCCDNPGGGGYGDSTRLLEAMIDGGIRNALYGSIYDPVAAQTCIDVGLGGHVVVELGGKTDPKFGAPFYATGIVQAITNGQLRFEGPMNAGTKIDMGPTVVLRIGDIDTLITSARFQVYDQMFFKHARIDLTKKSVIAVKSENHFRAAFAPIASEIICVDAAAGLTSANFKELPFRKVRRPVYPLDQE